MASQYLVERSAVLDLEGNYPGLTVSARCDLTLASFAAANGRRDELMASFEAKYGIALPPAPARITGKELSVLWSGRDQWIAMASRGDGRDLERELKPLMAGLASLTDQSDARAIFRLSGKRARDVLAKGVPIDLHPREFGVQSLAITHADHIGIILWQVDDAPTYELAVFRSFAQSLADWIAASARSAI